MGKHYESEASKEQPNLLNQVHITNLMLWRALAAALIKAKVIQRYELVDCLTGLVDSMGNDADGLPRKIAEEMKAIILQSVEPVPEIDPTTAQTLKDIARKPST